MLAAILSGTRPVPSAPPAFGTASPGSPPDQGGAIYLAGGTVTISNTVLQSNLAGSPNGDNGIAQGGAIFLGGGSLTLNNDSFNSNMFGEAVMQGGAICQVGGTLSATNCMFAQNAAFDFFGVTVQGQGGALYQGGGSAALTNDLFLAGRAANQGGAVYVTAGTLSVDNCTLSGNVAFDGVVGDVAEGGAIYVGGGTVTLTNSTFLNDQVNADDALAAGGAIYVAAGNATVKNCSFDGDSAVGVLGGDGFGGAVYVAPDGSITISKNTSFMGDSASTGGNNVFVGP
jgi:hypothetical protein